MSAFQCHRVISIPCTRNFIFLSAPSRLTVESQCLHLSLWMSSLVVVSALHPPASPSPHVLTEVSYLLLGKSMRLSARRPLVESAQLLTVACDLSRVSSSAISADGCGSLVRPSLVPRFQSVAPTTYEVTRVPMIWQPRHCGCLMTLLCLVTLRCDHTGVHHWPQTCLACGLGPHSLFVCALGQIVFASTLIIPKKLD